MQTYDRWTDSYKNTLPYLRFFNGTFDFKYPIHELEKLVPTLAGMEVLITARVGERFYDEIIEGYSIARVYNSSIKVSFMGGTPQVFKPTMPMTSYIVAEYHDGSKLPLINYFQGVMEISGQVESRSGRRDYPPIQLQMSDMPGVWELKVDLRNDLNLDQSRTSKDFLRDVTSLRLTANYIDPRGERAQSELFCCYLIIHHKIITLKLLQVRHMARWENILYFTLRVISLWKHSTIW
jgi:CD109 antigen